MASASCSRASPLSCANSGANTSKVAARNSSREVNARSTRAGWPTNWPAATRRGTIRSKISAKLATTDSMRASNGLVEGVGGGTTRSSRTASITVTKSD